MENDKIEVYNYLDGHSVINNSIIEGHFPNHGSFFKCPHRYMDRCRVTNCSLMVSKIVVAGQM